MRIADLPTEIVLYAIGPYYPKLWVEIFLGNKQLRSTIRPLLKEGRKKRKTIMPVKYGRVIITHYANNLIESFKFITDKREVTKHSMTNSKPNKFMRLATDRGVMNVFYSMNTSYVNGYICSSFMDSDFNECFLARVQGGGLRLLMITSSGIEKIIRWGDDDVVDLIMKGSQLNVSGLVCNECCNNCAMRIQYIIDQGFSFLTRRERINLYGNEQHPNAFKYLPTTYHKDYYGMNGHSFFYVPGNAFIVPLSYSFRNEAGTLYQERRFNRNVIAAPDFIAILGANITVTDHHDQPINYTLEKQILTINNHVIHLSERLGPIIDYHTV